MDIDALTEWYAKLIVVTPRALISTLLIPLFAPKLLPAPVRTVTALCIASVAIIGADAVEPFSEQNVVLLVMLLAKEVLVGLLIGLSFGMIFWIARSIGELIDYQVALTFSQTADPVNGQQVSINAMLIEKLLLAFVVASGGFLIIADTLLLSYSLWPPGELIPNLVQRATPLLVLEVSQLLSFALLLAGPVMLVVFMIDTGFGILGRAAPQLNLLSLTLPIKLPVALFVLVLALPFLLGKLHGAFIAVREALLTLMQQ